MEEDSKKEEVDDPFYTKACLRIFAIIIFGLICLISGAALFDYISFKLLFIFLLSTSGFFISLPIFNNFMKKYFNATWSSSTKGFILILLIISILSTINFFSSDNDINSNSQTDISSNNKQSEAVQQKEIDTENNEIINEKFKVEIGEVGDSGNIIRVTNRNSYDWHNIKITVNDYYSCWSREILKPNEVITVNALYCNEFVLNHKVVNSIEVVADEGKDHFIR